MTIFRHRITGPGSAGDVWVSTLHTSTVNDIDTVHLNWVGAMEDFWAGTYGALVTPQTQVTGFITDQLDPLTGKNVAQRSSNVALVGTGAGKTVSPRSCMVMSLTTNLPTRAGRGRMYWPSPDSGSYADTGEFSAGVVTSVANAFGAALHTLKFIADPVIYHRDTRTSTLIIGVKVGSVPGTQRRRTNKSVNNYAAHTI